MGTDNKSRDQFLLWAVLVPIVVAFFVYKVLMPEVRYRIHFNNYGRSHSTGRTLKRMQDIARMMESNWRAARPRSGWITLDLVYGNEDLPSDISILKDRIGFDPNNDRFLDYWDQPMAIEVIEPNQIRLISGGYNRVFDNGEGDDIIYEFRLRHE